MERKNAWKEYTEAEVSELEKLNESYRKFLDAGKTERECVKQAVAMAEAAGYLDLKKVIEEGKKVKAGDKLYAVNMKKSLALFQIGKQPLEKGMAILGAHIDSPRLDIKQNPLYEDTELAYLDTHYYGGIKKYQWVTLPLAIHGVIAKNDGTIVDVCIGEDENDPVFCVTDLLIHLAGENMEKKANKVIEGEALDILVGSRPLKGAEKEAVSKQILSILKEKYDMEGFKLTLKPGKKVKKAIIPVAGFGTRLYPETRSIKKEFFPIIDKDGYVKPVILCLLEQLEDSGIEEICLVIGEEEQKQYDEFFSPLSQEHISKLSEEKREYEEKILRIGKKITYVYQKERKGFGHAVYQCREFTNNEPVLLLLGDMIYQSYEDKTCSRQLIDAYEETGKTMVSMQAVPLENVSSYGILAGTWENESENLLKVTSMVEKPNVADAKDSLKVKTRKDGDKYFCAYGQYVLTPEVFEALEYNIENNITTKGEIQLTDALDSVRETYGIRGFVFNGKVYDVGTADNYRETLNTFCRED